MNRPVLLVLPFLFAACDPGAVVRGTVVDAHGARAIEGATVVLRWTPARRADGDNVISTTTNREGAFELFTVGDFPRDVLLEIRKDGLVSGSGTLAALCDGAPVGRCVSGLSSHYDVTVNLPAGGGR